MKAWPFAALLLSVACGGGSNDRLFEEPDNGGSAGKGTGGSTGGKGAGGTTGGTGTGGTGTGGTGTGGSATGGAGTGGTTGGTGAGGKGMTTGGTGGGGGSGGAGATAGSSAAGVSGGPAGAGGRGGGAAGRAGGGGSAGGPTCEGLANAYAEMLESALTCNPAIDAEQCTEHMPASIPCGCMIHVNPANEEALAELTRLADQHGKMGCVAVCPAIACLETDAVCTTSGSGSQGRCVESNATK